MDYRTFKAGMVGAGMMSGRYIKIIQEQFPVIEIKSICANHMENAQKKAEEFGLTAVTFEEMLADPEIELIINLTPACNHYEIVKAALMAGKNVYTEKSLTDHPETAHELMQLAKEKGLGLASAPDTFMGAMVETARKAIDDGLIGEVTSFAIAFNRDNKLLTPLISFLRMPGGGIVLDFSGYYLTALVSLLGPVDKVASFVHAPYKTHVNIIPQHPDFGKTVDTPNESEVSAILQMESGITGTIHMDSETAMQDQHVFSIYGTKGILLLGDPNNFGDPVRFVENSYDFANPKAPAVLPMANPYSPDTRGVGAADLVMALQEGRIPRADASVACHVLDVQGAILASGEDGLFHTIESTCEQPAALYEKLV